jgi:GxxExxY protein
MHFERTPLPIPEQVDSYSDRAIGAAIKVHKELGPGLLESVYEACLFYELNKAGIPVERQVRLPIIYDGITLDADLRLDLWLARSLIIEVKAVDTLAPIHQAQLLTYLKMTGNRLGLLMNFNVRLLRDGVKRVAL